MFPPKVRQTKEAWQDCSPYQLKECLREHLVEPHLVKLSPDKEALYTLVGDTLERDPLDEGVIFLMSNSELN